MTEIGLGLQSDKAPGDYARLAAAAEEHGIDVISVFGDLLYQPPVVPLLEMAAATSRVRLGAACWNPFTTHPYELAGQLTALDRLSGGRAYCGLARGTWLGALGVSQARPVAQLREAVALIRALLSGSAMRTMPGDPQAGRGEPEQGGDQLRLPGAGGADDADPLADGQVGADAVHQPPSGQGDGQVVHAQHSQLLGPGASPTPTARSSHRRLHICRRGISPGRAGWRRGRCRRRRRG
ncbi:hypothetical protein GCM10023162_36590 [Klenkia terrae]